jgi:sialate O-acetylesterase
MKNIIILLIAAILTITTSIAQQLKLAGVFGNNMVLQQNSNVELWGWNEPSGTIEITADWGANVSIITDSNGRWRAKLSTPLAISGDNTGHTISFKGKNNTVTLTDVLIGDVWICSGQSNMGYSMGATSNTRGVVDAEAEILLADYPQIRLFQVPQNPQSEEVELMPNAPSWSKCTPARVRYYSAVAYYFARKVQQETGIPVGIITTAFGSSRCESWTKKEVLLADPILKEKYYDPYIQNPTGYSPIQTSPTLLYNGMVAPIKKFTIKGLIWYQGEGNSGQPDVYPRLWTAMIHNFRSEWGQGNFQVYYVQLPQYSKGTSWPAFRNAQTTLLTVPNTGMAVSIDLNDIAPDDIHPMVKKPIGERLALWTLAKDYGKNILFSGPVLDQIAFSGNKAVVKPHH